MTVFILNLKTLFVNMIFYALLKLKLIILMLLAYQQA